MGTQEPAEPELSREFRKLLTGCLGCGLATPVRTCPGRGEPAGLVAADPPAAPLGHLIRGRLPRRGRRGVAVEVGVERITVLRLDGSRGELSRHRLQTVQVPPGRARVHSPAGALLAAAVGLDLPAEAGGELHQLAAALVDGSNASEWPARSRTGAG